MRLLPYLLMLLLTLSPLIQISESQYYAENPESPKIYIYSYGDKGAQLKVKQIIPGCCPHISAKGLALFTNDTVALYSKTVIFENSREHLNLTISLEGDGENLNGKALLDYETPDGSVSIDVKKISLHYYRDNNTIRFYALGSARASGEYELLLKRAVDIINTNLSSVLADFDVPVRVLSANAHYEDGKATYEVDILLSAETEGFPSLPLSEDSAITLLSSDAWKYRPTVVSVNATVTSNMVSQEVFIQFDYNGSLILDNLSIELAVSKYSYPPTYHISLRNLHDFIYDVSTAINRTGFNIALPTYLGYIVRNNTVTIVLPRIIFVESPGFTAEKLNNIVSKTLQSSELSSYLRNAKVEIKQGELDEPIIEMPPQVKDIYEASVSPLADIIALILLLAVIAVPLGFLYYKARK